MLDLLNAETEVFIPTRNCAATLERCLEGVKAAVPNCKITLVDRFSTDGTVQIAERYGASIVSEDYNLGRARTLICRMAKSQWFLMVDSDVYLPETWFQDMLHQLSMLRRNDEYVGVVQGRNLDYPVVADNRLRKSLLKMIGWREKKRKNYPVVNSKRLLTCAVLVNRAAVRGFGSDVGCFEDYELGKYVRKKGFNIYMVDVPFVHSEIITRDNLKRRARVAGAAMRMTKFQSFGRMLLGLLVTPIFRTPWGAKRLSFSVYWNYLAGYVWYKRTGVEGW